MNYTEDDARVMGEAAVAFAKARSEYDVAQVREEVMHAGVSEYCAHNEFKSDPEHVTRINLPHNPALEDPPYSTDLPTSPLSVGWDRPPVKFVIERERTPFSDARPALVLLMIISAALGVAVTMVLLLSAKPGWLFRH